MLVLHSVVSVLARALGDYLYTVKAALRAAACGGPADPILGYCRGRRAAPNPTQPTPSAVRVTYSGDARLPTWP